MKISCWVCWKDAKLTLKRNWWKVRDLVSTARRIALWGALRLRILNLDSTMKLLVLSNPGRELSFHRGVEVHRVSSSFSKFEASDLSAERINEEKKRQRRRLNWEETPWKLQKRKFKSRRFSSSFIFDVNVRRRSKKGWTWWHCQGESARRRVSRRARWTNFWFCRVFLFWFRSKLVERRSTRKSVNDSSERKIVISTPAWTVGFCAAPKIIWFRSATIFVDRPSISRGTILLNKEKFTSNRSIDVPWKGFVEI